MQVPGKSCIFTGDILLPVNRMPQAALEHVIKKRDP